MPSAPPRCVCGHPRSAHFDRDAIADARCLAALCPCHDYRPTLPTSSPGYDANGSPVHD